MHDSTRRIAATLIAALVILSLTASSFRASSAALPQKAPPSIQQSGIIVRASHTDSPSQRIPPPPGFSTMANRNATITVDYRGSWDQAARNAFQYAIDIWVSLINSPVEITVQAHWSSLGPGILGGAMGDTVIGFSGAPVANTWYPAALGHALSGQDVNDSDGWDFDGDGLDADIEIYAQFNQDFADWYFGTDGATPFDKWDFASVVLHELCHGLGFAGSMRVYNGLGYWGWGTAYPAIYDHFTENVGGGQLITAFPNNSVALATQLQSGNIYFNGPNANAANGGSRPELYAPNPWRQGSSYSHLGESFNGTPNALMTYAVNNGESAHDPGPVALGMFKDMGWTLPGPDLRLGMHVAEGMDLNPGDPVTFVISIENAGDKNAAGVVLDDSVPFEILSPSWSASPSLAGATARGGTTYVWDLPDLAVGTSGIISVSGTLSPSLPADFIIINEATISTTSEETNVHDNTNGAILGGNRVYLPLIGK